MGSTVKPSSVSQPSACGNIGYITISMKNGQAKGSTNAASPRSHRFCRSQSTPCSMGSRTAKVASI